MALISCPECSHQVSELAPTCPSCGFPIAAITEDGTVALRNCPDCGGSGIQKSECNDCVNGVGKCPQCRGSGWWYDEKCPDCGGSGKKRCEWCEGQGYFRSECETCNQSGQITLREFEEITSAKRIADEARYRADHEKLTEKQKKEAEAASQKLAALSERLSEVRGDLLQLGLSQGALILTDSVYALDRAKIMMTYNDHLQALRTHRHQCSFCGEALHWKERLRKLQAHDKQDCKEGWERVSKQIAENKVRYDEFLLEHAEDAGAEA